MTVDYDLIVLGGTAVGRYAAAHANQLGARVALIEPPIDWITPQTAQPASPAAIDYPIGYPIDYPADAWLEGLGLLNSRLQSPSLHYSAAEARSESASWLELSRHLELTVDRLSSSSLTPTSLAQLSVAGVEVIQASGSFARRLPLGFAVADRLLQSRAYLLTPPMRSSLPPIEGLATLPALRLSDFHPTQWSSLPQRLLIVGIDPRGLALAQLWQRLGVQVSLVTGHYQLLPGEDADGSQLLQAILEAEGVTVLTGSSIQRLLRQPDRLSVEVQQPSLETALHLEVDALLLATPLQLDLHALNLGSAGVKWRPDRIPVNRHLQTSQPRIYACGTCLGSIAAAATDRHEADIAIANALLLPFRQPHYRGLPCTVPTDPEWVRIGLTEDQARQQYGREMQVVTRSLQTLTKAQLQETPLGFLKLIAHPNGTILGAQAIGSQSSDWIGPIALAMQQGLSIQQLAQSHFPSPTFSELITQVAQQLAVQQRPEWQRSLISSWLDFGRSR